MGARIRAGRCVASITLAIVKVLPEPVTPSSTCVRSWRLTPSTSSLIACGWSPFGSKSEAMVKRLPPSDFSGRGGRCGVHGTVAEFRPAFAQQPFERLLAGYAGEASPAASADRRGGGEISDPATLFVGAGSGRGFVPEAQLLLQLWIEPGDGRGRVVTLRRLVEFLRCGLARLVCLGEIPAPVP